MCIHGLLQTLCSSCKCCAVPPSVIGQYFASSMVIVGMSVVATVIVLQFHHHNPNNGQMPRLVSFFSPSLSYICLFFLPYGMVGRHRHPTNVTVVETQKCCSCHGAWYEQKVSLGPNIDL